MNGRSQDDALLVLTGISKRFGSTQALEAVDFSAHAGRIHALVGENGAGKSTLVKTIGGINLPDAGTISLAGRLQQFSGPADASRAGIHLVHQELALLPNNTVAENVFLGHELAGAAGLSWSAMNRRAAETFRHLGLEIDVTRPTGELSTAQQQMVEIARATIRDFRVIILDEPTAALPPADTERLFAVLRDLAARGTAVIYISHRLDEIRALADDITVLKDGRHVATRPAAELDTASMIRLMVGRAIDDLFPPRGPRSQAAPILQVDGLIDPPRVYDVSFEIRAGEILGIYGLEGHGQDEVLSAIAGARRPVGGQLRLDGKPLAWAPVPTMIGHGIGFIPEDRKAEGLVLDLDGHANVSLPILRRLARHGWVNPRREREITTRAAGEAGVRGALDVPVRRLSGGNQQKVLLARWLAAGTRLFLMNQPTRGVDVGSKAEIYSLVRRQCVEHGKAALVVAREITELQGFCDRILVMSRGRMVAECSPLDSEEAILAAALGQEVQTS
ncbi:MAG: sugar ABC transporter ATP-binding protein [Rhodobacteraceae bacterium]|jgi:ABC-type sugar transport system ATPase subunit|nr:sugar ABC transporter ATP-binding protein [Paracoccaceae bacterium]